MDILCVVAMGGVGLVVVAMDLTRRINLMRLLPGTLLGMATVNIVLLAYGLLSWEPFRALSTVWKILYALPAAGLLGYWALRFAVFPVMDGHKTGIRLKLMIGGRFLVYRTLWLLVWETAFLLVTFLHPLFAAAPDSVLIVNGVCGGLFVLLSLWNGIVRLFFTSRRLSILRRVLMVVTMWIPVVNLIVLGYACRLARDEYDFALYKRELDSIRPVSQLCATKYPLLLVHGVLFRDLKYFNYWGRISRELLRCGATVFYGNQEAVGTIAYNGDDIHSRVLQILEETGCEKVNIIAHSKGGLDARYAIAAYDMADKVASLTCIGTPHRGCRFVDLAMSLPESFLRLLSRIVDNTYRRLGDENPDFYGAVHQFTTAYAAGFNAETPIPAGVYCQSYATRLKSMFGDSLLGLPYLLIKALEGDNDGLVGVESAKWGEFRGVLASTGRRGVSHGDIIDLKREDYKGFDVTETYVQMIADLKARGGVNAFARCKSYGMPRGAGNRPRIARRCAQGARSG
ncbi:triacylglycerol lipase [Ruminococcaceae bacterium OttesenSCG-928-L11]|nr:triacylglycerol lipase [Ruminococcaceae bacterium OttesenSCG-928-L11]